ncbi:hypothetical protein MCAV_05640 [[Mycoplasma] cavipharyngis]|uniref:hypothetical protein n=1 Tax=[Mycoplasma] cavipharyngis TaxID=92757 RepID=UPI0037047B01
MKINLLINLTNEQSSLTAYFYNLSTHKYEILDIVEFATDQIISNSTILDVEKLTTTFKQHYDLLCANVLVDHFQEINLVLPFQIPILNEQVWINHKFDHYVKKFDENQFFKIRNYEFLQENKKVIYSYFVNKSLFEKYQNLFTKLHLKISKIYTPALLIGQVFSQYSKYNVVIEFERKKITYNFYYGQNIINTKSISYGSDYLVQYLVKKLKTAYQLDQDFQIDQVIALLKKGSLFEIEKNVSLMLFFNHKPLTVLEFFIKTLKEAINEMIISISHKKLKAFQEELKINWIDNIFFYKNEYIYQIFKNDFLNLAGKWMCLKDVCQQFNHNIYQINDPIIATFFLGQNYQNQIQKTEKQRLKTQKLLQSTI